MQTFLAKNVKLLAPVVGRYRALSIAAKTYGATLSSKEEICETWKKYLDKNKKYQ